MNGRGITTALIGVEGEDKLVTVNKVVVAKSKTTEEDFVQDVGSDLIKRTNFEGWKKRFSESNVN